MSGQVLVLGGGKIALQPKLTLSTLKLFLYDSFQFDERMMPRNPEAS